MSLTGSETKPTVELGAALDLAVRKAAIAGLSDYYIGSRADYSAGTVSIFFSEEAKEESLKALVEQVKLENYSARFEKTDENGAAWVLTLKKEPESEVPTTGDVEVQVPFSGEVSVKGTSQEFDREQDQV